MDRPAAQARLRGSIAPLVTPFTEDDAIDEKALKRLIRWHIEEGSHGLSVTGTTGEPSSLTLDERERMIALLVEEAGGKVPTVPGTGTNNFKETLRLTRFAEREGADAALVIVPYYNRPSQEGLYQYFRALAEEVSLPLILYNIPGRTALNLQPETLARLYDDCANIIGVKESHTDLLQVSQEILLCPGINVYSGIEALCYPMLALGGAGHVSATANLLPRELARLYDLVAEGKHDEARELHYRLLPLNVALFLETNPGPLKTALGWMGEIHPRLRPPLVPPSGPNQERLRVAMAAWGLLGGGAA
ncbi:MAG: 4-hydroxy-tetrahydrodipicolinate synthase [Clostridiales bacterium]|nr:4-hydroxy-tetrahydrodipicolinate synthase [Clostridiales bacterium]